MDFCNTLLNITLRPDNNAFLLDTVRVAAGNQSILSMAVLSMRNLSGETETTVTPAQEKQRVTVVEELGSQTGKNVSRWETEGRSLEGKGGSSWARAWASLLMALQRSCVFRASARAEEKPALAKTSLRATGRENSHSPFIMHHYTMRDFHCLTWGKDSWSWMLGNGAWSFLRIEIPGRGSWSWPYLHWVQHQHHLFLVQLHTSPQLSTRISFNRAHRYKSVKIVLAGVT